VHHSHKKFLCVTNFSRIISNTLLQTFIGRFYNVVYVRIYGEVKQFTKSWLLFTNVTQIQISYNLADEVILESKNVTFFCVTVYRYELRQLCGVTGVCGLSDLLFTD